jgi:hypothetical protein
VCAPAIGENYLVFSVRKPDGDEIAMSPCAAAPRASSA